MLTVIKGRSDVPSGLAQGTFTGEAWRDTLLPPEDGVAVGNVFFAPCARTFWHSHVGGQLLIVLAGSGFVGDDKETVSVTRWRYGLDAARGAPLARCSSQSLSPPHRGHGRRDRLGGRRH